MPSLDTPTRSRRDRAPLRAREDVIPAIEWPTMAPTSRRSTTQEGPERRHPRAQLPDARDLPLRRRHHGRLAAARHRRGEDRRRHHRPVRRALHGRDLEAAQSRQARADPGQPRRLLARRVDHRRRRAPAARALSRRSGRHLRQHVRRREGRERHLLHVVERRAGRREPWRRSRDLPARPVPGEVGRHADRVKIIAWHGACEVHERFTGAELREYRDANPGVGSSPTPSARRMCSPRPTSPARPRR